MSNEASIDYTVLC